MLGVFDILSKQRGLIPHPFKLRKFDITSFHVRKLPVGCLEEYITDRKLYRFCDLGSALTESLTSMVQEKKLSKEQMESVLQCFDRVCDYALTVTERRSARSWMPEGMSYPNRISTYEITNWSDK